jgi:glycosyltransferase involved in cell wall biosynthesis
VVEEHCGEAPRTRLVTLRRHYCQTAALATGFHCAEGEVVVAMDGDGQNDPRDILRLVAKLDEGFDVVSGWRRQRRDEVLSKRLPNRVANRLLSRLARLRLHDFGCTLKAYREPVLRKIHLYGEMHRFLPAHLHRVGARVGELEVNHRPRLGGRSKYGPGRIFRVILDLVMIRFMAKHFTRPIHFSGQVGLWFFPFAGLVAALMVTFKYAWLRPLGIAHRADFVETPLPALAVGSGIAGVMSLFFGILAEILMRVLHESQGLEIYSLADCFDSAEPGPPAAVASGGSGRLRPEGRTFPAS